MDTLNCVPKQDLDTSLSTYYCHFTSRAQDLYFFLATIYDIVFPIYELPVDVSYVCRTFLFDIASEQ